MVGVFCKDCRTVLSKSEIKRCILKLQKLYQNLKFKEHPYYISLTGVIIALAFNILPMSPGYELALAYVPIFFLILGLVLTLLYWLLIKLTKNPHKFLFYLFLVGNLTWGLITAFEMAYHK